MIVPQLSNHAHALEWYLEIVNSKTFKSVYQCAADIIYQSRKGFTINYFTKDMLVPKTYYYASAKI